MAQWLKTLLFHCGGMGSISEVGLGIPHAAWHGQEKENRPEHVAWPRIYLWEHAPLVPKFDASGVTLGPKSPWKIRPSADWGSLPHQPPPPGCVFRQLHCIFRTILTCRLYLPNQNVWPRAVTLRSAGPGAKGNSSSGPRQVWAGSNQRVEEGKEGSPAHQEAW